ncbi:MAG TPA: CRTAC1 family protein [Verrucomicrobiae bacterium]|nr:CRTAC1 family protein [Verrucomicrobiae bacterium]
MKSRSKKWLLICLLPLLVVVLVSLRLVRAPMPWENAGSDVTTTNWLETRELEADKTVWAKEMLAEKCGRRLEDLWDRVNSSSNKLNVIAEFPVQQVVLPRWQPTRNLPHGIELREGGASGERLSASQWRQWLERLSAAGWALDNLELRHNAFDTDANGQPSRSRYYFAARLRNESDSQRALLEGDLFVRWGSPRSGEDSPTVQEFDGTHLVLKSRKGEPFFKEILAETITPAAKTGLIDPLIVYDLDGDGQSEIILAAANLVYRKRGDRYEPEPLCRYPIDFLSTALVADFDGDGYADLLCANGRGLFLFSGSSLGTFDAPPRLVWAAQPGLSNAMVMSCGDIAHTGHLDVFVGQYRVPYLGQILRPHYYDANDGWPCYLLRNDGKGNFTDVTANSGLEKKRNRRVYSATFVDLDGDGNLDLVVVSDFAGLDLYQNDGQGHFKDATDRWVSEPLGFGMASALADFNADGRLDLLMIGMPSPTVDRLQYLNLWRPSGIEEKDRRPAMAFGNRLLLARPDGGFEQTKLSSSIVRSGWSWGCCAFDFDNDGFPDVYIANGLETKETVRDYESEFWLHDIFVEDTVDDFTASQYFLRKHKRTRGNGWSYGGYEKNRLFVNLNGESFAEIGQLAGVSLEEDSRNVVGDDLDGDGRVDLVVTTHELWPQVRQTLRVFKNQLRDPGNWIGFRFAEKPGRHSPVGASVTIHFGGRTETRTLLNGDSHRSQSSNTVHIGIGEATRVDSAEIRFPDASKLVLSSLPAEKYYDLSAQSAESNHR